jgi:hypothetical protein
MLQLKFRVINQNWHNFKVNKNKYYHKSKSQGISFKILKIFITLNLNFYQC